MVSISLSGIIKQIGATKDNPISLGTWTVTPLGEKESYKVSCYFAEGFVIKLEHETSGDFYISAPGETFEDAIEEMIEYLVNVNFTQL